MEFLKVMTGGFAGIIWMIAGPVTYIINVVDTWSGKSSAFVNILINLTLDAILAFIWPVTWLIWLVMMAAGSSTPLERVLGL